MTKLIKLLLFFVFTVIISAANAETTEAIPTETADKETASDNQKTEELVVTDFLFKEIIPAFGGLEQIFLTNTPSFRLQFTQNGLVLESCSLEFKLKQLKTIHYQIADEESDGFTANMSIGQPVWLFFHASCIENNTSIDKNHFNLSITIKDENFEDSYYELIINSFDKAQLKIKLYAIEIEVIREEVDQEILVSSHGDIMEFSQELVDYETEDGSYSLPASLWNPLHNVTASSPKPGDFIELKKIRIKQIISVDGVARFLFPTSANSNITQDTDVAAPVKGQIFIPEEEESDIIPVIDINVQ